MTVPAISIDELLSRYDVFLVDAYGVLVTADAALPGAAAFLERVAAEKKRFAIVSNDASRSPETSADRYAAFGLPISAADVITSGMLLRDHFAAAGLVGRRTIVLGTSDSEDYVRQAGGVVVPRDDAAAEVLVVADDDGFPFLDGLNDVATVILTRLERGLPIHLVLPNPDLVFPRAADAFGITAGAMAVMLEAIARLRAPEGACRFVPLGKPHPPMFEAAFARFPGVDRRRVVMLGDQLATDVAGAARAGIDSVLLGTGVARLEQVASSAIRPTWWLAALAS